MTTETQTKKTKNRKSPFKVLTNNQRILEEFKKRSPDVWFNFDEINSWAFISGLSAAVKSGILLKLTQDGFLERRTKLRGIEGRHPYEYRFRKGSIRNASYYLRLPYSRVFVPEESGGFSTRILEFPGCFSEGETLEEAYKNLEEAARCWLNACIAQGTAIPLPGIPCFTRIP